MASTQIGVIYDPATLVVKRLVIPDADYQLAFHAQPGEGLLLLSQKHYRLRSIQQNPCESIPAVAQVIEDAKRILMGQ